MKKILIAVSALAMFAAFSGIARAGEEAGAPKTEKTEKAGTKTTKSTKKAGDTGSEKPATEKAPEKK